MNRNSASRVDGVESELSMFIPTGTGNQITYMGKLRSWPRNKRYLTYLILATSILSLIIIFSPQIWYTSETNLVSNYYLPSESSHLVSDKEKFQFLPSLKLPNIAITEYQRICYPTLPNNRSISHVYKKLKFMSQSPFQECKDIADTFSRIYDIQLVKGDIHLPAEFVAEVKGWLNNDEELFKSIRSQDIYKVLNKVTGEASVFNQLRSKRPVSKPSMDPLEYVEEVANSARATCDFCTYREHTAEDIFGRIENKFSASSSNTFKLAKFHGLFFPYQHHPLNISYAVLADLFLNTAQQWFKKAYEMDSTQIYPTLLWDTLPHAGASQVHPHVHGLLDSNQYAGMFGVLHRGTLDYFQKYGRLLWSDILLIHWALDLVVVEGDAVAIVPITARKDHEYMVLSPTLNENVIAILWRILQAYRTDLNTFCSSAGASLPLLHKPESGLPVIFRLGSRGDCTTVRSDVSSLELYTVNNINSDLGATFAALKKTKSLSIPS